MCRGIPSCAANYFFAKVNILMTKQIRFIFIFWGLLVTAFLSGVFAERSVAEMYKWVDKNGVTHFSDTPPAGAENLRIETLPTYKTNENNVYSPENESSESKDIRSRPADPIQDQPEKKKPKVELYTTSWCPWCEKAKSFFRSRGIEFVEYDIEKDETAARRKDRLDSRKGVPFAVINGEGIHGYNEAAYTVALRQ